MAIKDTLRELPWYVQGVGFVALAVVIVLVFEYAPFSPITQLRSEKEQQAEKLRKLIEEVSKLQVVELRHRQFKADTEALEKQLANLQTLLPDERASDEYIRQLQDSAVNAGIAIRHFTAKPVASRELYSEMPFQLELDGGYYNVLTFFDRLSKLSRIVNVTDIKLGALAAGAKGRFSVAPGTTVNGSCIATTFFTKSVAEMMSEQEAKAAPAKGAAAKK